MSTAEVMYTYGQNAEYGIITDDRLTLTMYLREAR